MVAGRDLVAPALHERIVGRVVGREPQARRLVVDDGQRVVRQSLEVLASPTNSAPSCSASSKPSACSSGVALESRHWRAKTSSSTGPVAPLFRPS